MIRNEVIEVPVEKFEDMLRALYFEEACHKYNIEKWYNYKDVCNYMKARAWKDINNGN